MSDDSAADPRDTVSMMSSIPSVPAQVPAAPPADRPYRLLKPERQAGPLLVSSPHSGRAYTPAFVSASRLDFQTLRRSEDCLVDDLLADAVDDGIPILNAEFPRAFCDVNREAWELDPAMFADKLPHWCNTRTARVHAGFGTIARLVSLGQPIYAEKLLFAEAETRIRTCWQPYHAALAGMICETVQTFGRCVLLDCHSMPTGDGPLASARADTEPGFVLGDAHGTSCDPLLPRAAQRFLESRGYRVRRNDPYAGGYVTRHYGRPRQRTHVLQIEISRSLYLDQRSYLPLRSFGRIRDLMTALLQHLTEISHHLPG